MSAALLKLYGSDYQISNEDCIGHIQIRIGSNVRKYKKTIKNKMLPRGPTVGGYERVTDAVIDSIQNYYCLAIRNNLNNVTALENAISAIYFHISKRESEDLRVQHRLCPKYTTQRVMTLTLFGMDHVILCAHIEFFELCIPLHQS